MTKDVLPRTRMTLSRSRHLSPPFCPSSTSTTQFALLLPEPEGRRPPSAAYSRPLSIMGALCFPLSLEARCECNGSGSGASEAGRKAEGGTLLRLSIEVEEEGESGEVGGEDAEARFRDDVDR